MLITILIVLAVMLTLVSLFAGYLLSTTEIPTETQIRLEVERRLAERHLDQVAYTSMARLLDEACQHHRP